MRIRPIKSSWFTRSLSFILTLLMILGMFPTTAFAANTDEGYVGGGTGDENFTDSSTWRANWNSNQIGVRVSIVNHDGENMLINRETGKPYVVDLLFSQPPGNTLYMSGNKFQDWDGESGQSYLPIPLWKFNNLVNAAIDANPALELKHLDPYPKEYTTWPSTYTGLPSPITKSSSGKWIGNGVAVKDFFIKGAQGSFNAGRNPTINIDSLPHSDSGSNKPGSNAGKPATSGTGNKGQANTIKTPYGNVTQQWLDDHRRAVQNNSIASYLSSGYITSSEKQQINSHIQSARNTNIGALNSAIRRLVANLNNGTTRIVTKAEFDKDSYNWYKSYLWSIASNYDTGQVTYEAMRVNNTKIIDLSEISRTKYAQAISIYSNKNYSTKTKITLLNSMINSSGNYYYSSIKINNGAMIISDEIPLVPTSVSGNIASNTLKNINEIFYKQLVDTIFVTLNKALVTISATDIKNDLKISDISDIEVSDISFSQNMAIKGNIATLMKVRYGDNSEVVIQNLGGLDELCKVLIEEPPSTFTTRLTTASADLQNSEYNFSKLDINNLFSVETTPDGTASITAEELGDIKGITMYTSAMVDEIIKAIVIQLENQAITTITYDSILAKLNGETKEEKLENAAIQINKIGLQQWIDSLDLSSATGFDDSQITLYQNKGYIGALLDIKKTKDGSDYIFDIKLDAETEKKYEEMLSLTSDGNQAGRPSYRYVLGEYALVLEPIYWYKPVSFSSNSWKADTGAYDGNDNFLYRCKYNVYGTPTNFAKWMNSDSTHYPSETGHTSLNRLMAMSMYIDEEIVYFNKDTANVTINPINVPSGDLTSNGVKMAGWRQHLSAPIDNNSFGYGWHFAGGNVATSPSSGTVTWRSPDPSPGKAPDPSGLPDPSKDTEGKEVIDEEHPNGIPDKHFTIIKYYEDRDYTEDPDNPEITRSGPTIREQNPNIIKIVDEPKYKVEDWYTTSKVDKPTENDTTDDYYVRKEDNRDSHVQLSNLSNKNTTVELDKENKYKTDSDGAEQILYVLLVKSTKAPVEEGKITIQQSQITKAVHTNNKTIGGNWGNYNFTFTIGSFQTTHDGDCGSCHGGHGEDGDCGHCHGGHPCPFSMPGGAGDNKLKFVFTGLHSINFGTQPEIGDTKHRDLAPKSYTNNGIHDKTLSSLAQATFKFNSNGMTATGAEYTTVLWRFNDIPTLAQYKKTDISNRYGKSNYEIPATILPQSNVSQNKRTRDKVYTSSIAIDFGINKGLSDLRAVASCNGSYTNCFAKDPQDVSASTWSYSFGADVLIKTYRGKDKVLAQEPFEGATEKKVTNSSGVHFAVTTVQDKQQIKFFPYIKMTYQTNELNLLLIEEQGNANTRYDTYVLSEQKSSILPSDAVEVGWSNPNETKSLNLISQQWSLHQKAISGSDGWQGKNQVLPGGAIYQLNTGNNETNVKLVTYQTVVDQKTRAYLSDALTGSEYTEDQVKKDHKSFVDNAKEVLDNLRVVQWVSKSVKDATAWPSDWAEGTGNKVCIRGGGQALNELGLNTKTNTDTKYYMQKAGFGQPASEGDLDIINETQVTTVFKVFADTEGKVWMVKASDLSDDVSGLVDQLKDINADTKSSSINAELLVDKNTKWEDVNGKLTGDAKSIDDRTKIITNVVKALEKNTGADRTAAWARSDGKWYNEAFDGIYLVHQSTTLQVGFKDPAKRAAALDPALCPENKGQSDLYSKAFLSQFCMNDKSDAAIAKDKESQYIGTFKGVDIKLPDMQGLYQSRQFFIPNANVQDLK